MNSNNLNISSDFSETGGILDIIKLNEEIWRKKLSTLIDEEHKKRIKTIEELYKLYKNSFILLFIY